jgi:hypothetical protein
MISRLPAILTQRQRQKNVDARSLVIIIYLFLVFNFAYVPVHTLGTKLEVGTVQ